MSLLDAPMALLDRVLARSSSRVHPEDPVARMVARTTGRLRPARAYRRRLRGHVMNQYVAVREGLTPAAPRRREMGRIGRSVLVASLGLALSVTAVGAASRDALPGDALYPVKRQLEEVRLDIAPAWARPALVAMALDERLAEVEQLARDGRWDRVGAASADVEAAAAALGALSDAIPQQQQDALTHHAQVLGALLLNAPDAAKPGLEHALAASDKAAAVAAAHGGGAHGSAGVPGQNGSAGTREPASPAPGKSPKPAPSTKPGATPATPSSPSAH